MRTTLSIFAVALLSFIVFGCEPTKPPTPSAEVAEIQPNDARLAALVALARQNVRLEKAALVAESLPLTEAEAAEFWPIHRQYEQELGGLMDRKITLIRDYFVNKGKMTDAQAKTLAKETLDLESQRTDLKREYFKKFQAAIPATKAARFFQIENQLNMLIELQIASELPLIK